MQHESRFRVRADLDTVRQFHSRPDSLRAITPPPVLVGGIDAPERLDEGDEMGFTLWLGPLPVRWLSRIEEASDAGFTDVQLRGPFARWRHRHEFVGVDEATTEVRDTVEWRLDRRPDKALIGLGMAATLPVLFGYRAWRTRRLLEQRRV